MPEAGPGPARAGAPDRRSRKKARTRQQIYAAAMRCFSERGFDAVTVEEICAAADVARGTFFAHFPTKASLLHEFGRSVAAELRADPREYPDAASELRCLLDLLCDKLISQADVLSAMLREFNAHPTHVGDADDERGLSHWVHDIIARGQARGELRRSIDPELATGVFLATSMGVLKSVAALHTGRLHRPGLTPQAIRMQYFELMFRGLVES